MSTPIKILLGFFAICVILVGGTALSLIGSYNSAVSQEAGIKAQYKQNQNQFSSHVQKILEMAQVPAMYTDDIMKVYAKVMEGRKGSENELVRMITEANPNFDSKMYLNLQQAIEADRNEFKADQQTLLDKKRVYETTLGAFPSNVVLGAFGFPRINLAEYDIVTDDQTETAFKTKKAVPIKLREEAKTVN